MPKQVKIEVEEKLMLVQVYMERKLSITETSKQIGVGETTVRLWIVK